MSKDYLIAEFNACRERISSDIDEINKREIFYLTFIGLTYGAIFQLEVRDIYAVRIFCCIALIASMYGFVAYWAHRNVIRIHERYIKERLEKVMIPDCDQFGMVSFYDANKNSGLKYARFLLHILLVAFTAAILFASWWFPEYAVSIVGGAGA